MYTLKSYSKQTKNSFYGRSQRWRIPIGRTTSDSYYTRMDVNFILIKIIIKNTKILLELRLGTYDMQSGYDTCRTSAYANDFFFWRIKKNLRNIYVRLCVIEIVFQMWKKPQATRKHVISRRQVR